MHGRFWMNTWSKEINLDDYAECKEFRIHYYTRYSGSVVKTKI